MPTRHEVSVHDRTGVGIPSAVSRIDVDVGRIDDCVELILRTTALAIS